MVFPWVPWSRLGRRDCFTNSWDFLEFHGPKFLEFFLNFRMDIYFLPPQPAHPFWRKTTLYTSKSTKDVHLGCSNSWATNWHLAFMNPDWTLLVCAKWYSPFPPYLIKQTCCDAFVGKIDLPAYNQYLSTSSFFNLGDSPLIECSLRKISESINTIPWGVRNHFFILWCNETKLRTVIIPILCMSSWLWYSQFSCKHAGEYEKNSSL